MADIVKLALAFLAAEEAEAAIRLRLLRCARDRDHVLLAALEIVHAGIVERRNRASERLRAVQFDLDEAHGVALAALSWLVELWPVVVG